jgi:hypothetical protein
MLCTKKKASMSKLGEEGNGRDRSAADTTADPFEEHWKHYPQSYIVQRLSNEFLARDAGGKNGTRKMVPAFPIDGDLDKDVWKNVPWSQDFDDIQGVDAPSTNSSIPVTKFRALYDDYFLYVIAILYPSTDPDRPTVATFTQRNAPIFTQDSDIEVFIDALATHHNYKEFEMNAINTVWNLMLNKPYIDGGYEHSARVSNDTADSQHYYEVYQQHSATALLNHTSVNDPSGRGALWTAELAFAWSDIYNGTLTNHRLYRHQRPTRIRINFSRVELQGEINWTWQPQYTWDAASGKYRGVIDMHRPEAWGYFVLAPPNSGEEGSNPNEDDADKSVDHTRWCDPTFPARLAAIQVYSAQHAFRSLHGFFTNDVSQLLSFMDPRITSPFHIQIECSPNGADKQFTAFMTGPDPTNMQRRLGVSISDDRLVQVLDDQVDHHGSHGAESVPRT